MSMIPLANVIMMGCQGGATAKKQIFIWLLWSWHSATSITVQITGSVATPALGQSYSLTCEVSGASGPVSAYQWRRDDTVLSETGPILSFSPLTLSDAGQYTCQVTVDGMMLSRTKDIRLTS